MTRFTPLWLQGGNYAASVDRRLIGALWPEPRCDGMTVLAGAGMAVTVDPGMAAVPTSNGTGSTLCVADAQESLSWAQPAPPSGQDRYDLIIVRPRATDIDGAVDNDWIWDIEYGVVAATGQAVVPPAPGGTIPLASHLTVGGSAAVDPTKIADLRPQSLVVGAGDPPGIIKLNAAPIIPIGWHICDGSALDRMVYGGLFAAIGTTYGPGDGVSSFNVPNLIDRFARGKAAPGAAGGAATHSHAAALHTHPLSDAGAAKGFGAATAPPNLHLSRVSTSAFNPWGGAGVSGSWVATAANSLGLGLAGRTENGGAATDAPSHLPPYVELAHIIKL
jgi:microcystin-dependent protein